MYIITSCDDKNVSLEINCICFSVLPRLTLLGRGGSKHVSLMRVLGVNSPRKILRFLKHKVYIYIPKM